MADVLIVDDDARVRALIRRLLARARFTVREADSCTSALAAFRPDPPDVTLCDYELPDGNALDLLPQFRAIDPTSPVIILTGHGTIELAVRAIKEGAEQFLTKPVDGPALLALLRRVVERRRGERRHAASETRRARAEPDPFLGTSSAIRSLAGQATRIAASGCTVLIQGETGSGKGVLAHWLHHQSPRSEDAFVDINCAGLTGELLESELFGHEKGAFTGAAAAKQGLLEVAHHGTVFLDEIGDMDLRVQAKLLKVIEEKRFRRLGDVEDRGTDVRVIAATHHDLGRLVQSKSFREDLYFRINTVPLAVPPLRDRVEDIPALAERILARLAAELAHPTLRLSPAAVQALQGHAWPGNIRELRNVLERAALLSGTDHLEPPHLQLTSSAADSPPAPSSLQEAERQLIARVLREEGGRVVAAAARLGIPRSSLYQKIRKHGIDVSSS